METTQLARSQNARQSLTIGEQIAEANQEPRITEAKEKDFSDLFKHIFNLLGIRPDNFPTPTEKQILIKYVFDNMSRWSIRDFVNAFTFGIQGKLDMDLTSYDKFNPFYLEKVMQSYARFRMNHTPEFKQLTETTPLTEEEKRKEIEAGCVFAFEQFKAGKPLIDFGNITYLHLERIGAINLSYERKSEIYNKAESRYLYEQTLRANKTMKLMKHIVKNGLLNLENIEIKNRIKEIARHIALQEYFNHLIEMGDDLKTVIESINNPQNN